MTDLLITNDYFPQHTPLPQRFETLRRSRQRNNAIDHWLQHTTRGPFQRLDHINAIPSVAAAEPLLFHEQWQEFKRDSPPRRCAAGDDASAAREAIETFDQHIAADMFDDDIHAALIRDATHFRRPFRVV